MISKKNNDFIDYRVLQNVMQSDLDNLIIPSLRRTIEENLGVKTLNKIEQRLIERHGINLAQSIKEFYKFDSVLREFFGAGADGLETKFLNGIVELEKSSAGNLDWITIHDKELARTFLESFGDPEKKCILTTVLDKPLIVADILKSCKIAQTSGYRKVNSLIDEALLVPNGHIVTDDGKKVQKYGTPFRNVNIKIEQNSVVVKVQLQEKSIENSSILQIIKV